jgi:hypothetical protein
MPQDRAFCFPFRDFRAGSKGLRSGRNGKFFSASGGFRGIPGVNLRLSIKIGVPALDRKFKIHQA